MNHAEMELVRRSWQLAAEEPLRLSILFFDRLFDEAPELRSVFRTPMSEKTKQLLLFFGFHIDMATKGSAKRPSFEAYIWEELLTEGQQEFVMRTLTDTVASVLGASWNAATTKAWASFRQTCLPHSLSIL